MIDDNVNVMLYSAEEFIELAKILNSEEPERNYSYPCAVNLSSMCWSGTGITLAEFKKEQGIMKYNQDDVLEADVDDSLTIQGYVGCVYVTLHQNGHAAVMSEGELDAENYTLKTDTPTKTDMTVAEIAKKLGMKPEELNVVADK